MGLKTYIIAEAGVNHNGSLELAIELVDAAADAGADAVKFQTFKAERLVSRSAPKANYQKETTGETESQYTMLKKLELDRDMHQKLVDHCRRRGIQFLSTPFDEESVALLAGVFDLPILKIPSGEITNGPLLLQMARNGKPVMMSTGMSTLGEVETALGVLAFGYTIPDQKPSAAAFQEAYFSEQGQQAIRSKVTLLHCTTEYPTPYEDVHLKAMDTLMHAFGLPCGYSDHTLGIAVPIAAVARGAVVIEKHFTLDRSLPGPDHRASLEPNELKAMVESIRQIEQALGQPRKKPTPVELQNRLVARKSIVAVQDIKVGERLAEHNIGLKRPGTGQSPIHYWDMLGKEAARSYRKDELM
jgi:N-acetylneuraminate synthase